MADLQKLAEEIQGLTLLEASQLVKILEEKLGVTAAAPVTMAAVAMPGAGAAAAPAEVEEKTEFDVVLEGFGDKKIGVIKVVRAATNLGLKEAKDLVDGAPKPIKEKVSKEEADSIKAKFEEVGATIELQ